MKLEDGGGGERGRGGDDSCCCWVDGGEATAGSGEREGRRRREGRSATATGKAGESKHTLRNVIERAYGVLKARFPILKQMASYPFPKQIEVVVACFVIHNFIRRCNIQDQLFMEYDENAMFTVKEEHGEDIEEEIIEVQWGSSQDNGYMANLRDQIATHLFSND
ncbi:hypothetical protein OSB04_006561 [Centaurea solstitialis]|uniref:DDE Tnp4 domain-containing protein n=1 Tax=Centaurea solstitialis TaxID=347529 RepID=A0AA38TTQ5_9ASTR|nr:hypothetical protein OSB04_006561 [Centaurea solstitialis]